jgi:hypothetical protein
LIGPAVVPYSSDQTQLTFLISNFRRVLNVLFILLGDIKTSEFYMPTFRNTVSFHRNRQREQLTPMTAEETRCSETSVHKIQTPVNYQKERIEQLSLAVLYLMARFFWKDYVGNCMGFVLYSNILRTGSKIHWL